LNVQLHTQNVSYDYLPTRKKNTMPNYINVEITYPPNDSPSDTCSRSNVPLTKYLSVTHEITYPPISTLPFSIIIGWCTLTWTLHKKFIIATDI